MAQAIETHSIATSFAERLDAAIDQAKLGLRRGRIYRRTLFELQSLTDRDLADLGLSRSMLRGVAKAAAEDAA